MVEIVGAIVGRRSGAFEPASFGDRYQDALRELVEAKTKGLATTPRAIAEPPKVINLMEALKRRLSAGRRAGAEESGREQTSPRKGCCRPASTGNAATRSGGREKTDAAVTEPAASTAPKRPKRA